VTATTGPSNHHAEGRLRPAQLFTATLATIVALQAIWLGVLMSRGWYYQADFSNLASATGRRLSLSYLTSAQGGHLAPADRLTYWFFNRIAPLNHSLTIALRLAVQAVTTVLLARVLTLLVGRRPGVLVVVGLYAFTPMLVQTQLWFTAAVAFLPSQLLLLLALQGHLRYWVNRTLKTALWTSAAVFAATMFSEQAAVTVLIFPMLSAGFLFSGTWRERVKATAACWPEWAAIAAPLLGFVTYFLASGKYTNDQSSAISLTVGHAVRVLMVEIRETLLPAMAGGPLNWLGTPSNYLSLSAPPAWFQFLAFVLVTALIVITVRRTGRIALLAWAMPLVVLVIGMLIVAAGRYAALGSLIARQYEHTGYVAIPLAIAACLAFYATTPPEIRERIGSGPGEVVVEPMSAQPWVRWVAGGLAVGVVIASLGSALTYTSWWSKNPAHRFVRNLDAHLRVAGPNVAIYDTPLNQTIIPGIEPAHYASDLVGLMDLHARFNTTGSAQVIVGADGSLQRASLFVVARGLQAPSPSCAAIVKGVGTWTVALSRQPKPGEYYLSLSYLQTSASVVYLTVTDPAGHSVAPVRGQRTELPPGLGEFTARLPITTPHAVVIRSESLATNVCISQVVLGAPILAHK